MPQSPLLRPAAPATDSLRAVADTATAAGRALADSVRTLADIASDPHTSGFDLFAAVQARLLNPALWLGLLGFVVKAVIVVVLAHGVLRLTARASRAYVGRFRDLPSTHARRQRVTTIAALLTSVARYVVWPVAAITILDSAGFSVTSLLATAGIAGLAVGFGAQTLVRDVISGFFLLFDDTLSVGDTVRIGADEGTVEFIGVRLIKVRKFDGELLMVPSGELRIFGNRSIGFARIVVNVTLPFSTPSGPVLQTMQRVADAWAEVHRDVLLDDAPDVQAVTSFGERSATVRVVAKAAVGEQYAAERDLRRRLLDAFAEAGYDLGPGASSLLVQSATTVTPPPAAPTASAPAPASPDATDTPPTSSS